MATTIARAGSPRATRLGVFGLNTTFLSGVHITRRHVQIVLAPLAVGQPLVVAGPIRWAASMFAALPVAGTCRSPRPSY
jgi:hypothetical protein